MVKRGKQYTEASKAVEKDRLYSAGEAVELGQTDITGQIR